MFLLRWKRKTFAKLKAKIYFFYLKEKQIKYKKSIDLNVACCDSVHRFFLSLHKCIFIMVYNSFSRGKSSHNNHFSFSLHANQLFSASFSNELLFCLLLWFLFEWVYRLKSLSIKIIDVRVKDNIFMYAFFFSFVLNLIFFIHFVTFALVTFIFELLFLFIFHLNYCC